MNRNFAVIVLSTALALVLAVSAAAGPGGQSKGPKVKSIVSVEGVITAVDEGRSSFTMRVLTPGHQRLVGANTMTVQVQGSADIHFAQGDDDIDRPARIREFRVGDRVHVQALRLDSGQFLAIRVVVQNRQSGSGETTTGRDTAQGQSVDFQGVVIEKGNRSLRVRQTNGNVRTVLVTSNTEITGRVDSFRDIRVNDPVDVRGTLNADGSVVARRIAVLRSTANETSISGTIALKNSTGARFLILNSGLAVSVSENTRIVSGGRTRSFDDLRTGMTITVQGSPITVSGLTVGINARLITY
ncbi:MAG TPA: DUF5666 domain-containing protein [bacterium]